MKTMKAYVIETPGPKENLILRNIEIPAPKDGWILIKIKAFGLNRAEWFTRNGDSPSVKFPRVLGIECVGEVEDASNTRFKKGQKVAALMGGMGRDFDGSYAEYTLVPESNVFLLETSLDWKKLAALPEMLQTTHGSLYQGLEIERASTILIRGGTSSIGLCALSIAKIKGLKVVTTTRSEAKAAELESLGADHVLIEDGKLAPQIKKIFPSGVDRVLELIGTKTLLDSMNCIKPGGTACMTGILGGEWELKHFRPMEDIPTSVKLTGYSGDASNITEKELNHYLREAENGNLNIKLGPSFSFEDLHKGHQLIDENRAGGKMVIYHRENH